MGVEQPVVGTGRVTVRGENRSRIPETESSRGPEYDPVLGGEGGRGQIETEVFLESSFVWTGTVG